MDPTYITGIIGIVSAIGGAGGALGVTKQRIRRTEEDVVALKSVQSDQQKLFRVMGERLASIEGKLDLIVQRRFSE